jgi:transcriptional regulator with XRE-family HTH domain
VDVIERLEETSECTKFKQWREAQGFTVREVAGLLGCSHAHAHYIETGRQRIHDPAVRVRIARALGARVQDLFEPIEQVFGTE